MATTKLNLVQDTLLQGLNKATGDSIIINMNNNVIDRLQIIGGAEGTYIPERNNSKIDSTIVYKADYIDYLVNKEISYLINNAYVNYDFTELNSGQIYVDWKKNFLEATEKDGHFPSINGFSDFAIEKRKFSNSFLSALYLSTTGFSYTIYFPSTLFITIFDSFDGCSFFIEYRLILELRKSIVV